MSLHCFAEIGGEATPLVTIGKAELEQLETSDAALAQWLKAFGFKAEPGQWAFAPDAPGKPRVVVAPPEGNSRWALAALPFALPPGDYIPPSSLSEEALCDAALGWALGAYAFTRYKAPKRPPAADTPFYYFENIDGGHGAAANRKEAARRQALEFTYLARRLMN